MNLTGRFKTFCLPALILLAVFSFPLVSYQAKYSLIIVSALGAVLLCRDEIHLKFTSRSFVFLCLVLINLLFSVEIHRTFVLLTLYFSYFLAYIAGKNISVSFETLIKYICITGLIAVLGAFLIFGMKHFTPISDQKPEKIESYRLQGTFNTPSALGGFLLMILPFSFFGYIKHKNILYLITSLILLAGILATLSIGSLLVLMCMVALTVYFTDRRKLRLSLLVILLILVITAGAFTHLRGIGIDGIKKLKSPILKRWMNWKGAFSILRNYPVTGTGLGNFGIVYPEYLKLESVQTQFVHNSYLQLLTEMGLPFVFFIILFLSVFYKRCKKITVQSGYHFAFFLSCFSFILHNFVDFTLYLPATGLTFFFLLGILYGKDKAEETLSAFLTYIVLAGFLLAGIFAVRGYAGSHYFEKANINVEKGNYKTACTQINKSISIESSNPGAHIFLSQLLLNEFDGDRTNLRIALTEVKQAIEQNPHTPYYRNIEGKIYLKLDQPLRAFESFHHAHRLYPVKLSYKKNIKKVRKLIER